MNGGIAYNGSAIIPAPFCSLEKVYHTTQDGTRIGSSWSIILEGKFLPTKGSPDASGILYGPSSTPPDYTLTTAAYMDAILRKQEAIRDLFADEGKQLVIRTWNNGSEISCNPRIKTPISFPKGNNTSWASIAEYKVVLEADIVYKGISGIIPDDSGDIVNYHVETADDTWNIEPQDYDLGTWRLSHQVSAKGSRFYSSSGTLNKEAWQNARDYVLTKIGLDSQFIEATGILNQPMLAYNYVRTQNVNELGGTFAVNETWLCLSSGNPNYRVTDEYEVDVRTDMAGVTQVGLRGKLTGLEVRDANTRALSSTKYANAISAFGQIESSFSSRASGIANIKLNSQYINKTIGHNTIAGVITYNYDYDNRATASVSGALSQILNVSYRYPLDVFAELPVLGRAAGPVLQSIQTITSSKKSVSLEVVMPATTQSVTTGKPDTDSLISAYIPSATSVFKSADNENWDASKGRYSRQVEWTYGN